MQLKLLESNYSGIPIFRALDFSYPPDFSNRGIFPLDLLQSNTVILPPIFQTFDFSKLPIFRTNSCLPWKKFIRNLPSISQTRRKVLLSSVQSHFRSLFLYSKGRTTLYNTGNSTKKSTAQCLSFECLGHSCLLCVRGGYNFRVLSKILNCDHSDES